MKRAIFSALEAQLIANLPWLKTLSWKKIRVLASDFMDHEIPVVQFYHLRTDYTHQTGAVEGRMKIAVEVVAKNNSVGVDQLSLFDLMRDVELAIGANPNLGVPGVIHCQYLSDETDLHSIEPFLVGVLTFDVIHRKPFSGC